MTINKSSGDPLSFLNDIEAEFGSNPGRSLGQYRSSHANFQNKNLGALSNLPLDTGIPASGEIKFSHFYGKKLNVVVDYYNDTGSAGGEANNVLNRQDNGANTMAATWRYNNQSERVKVVGGYRSRPTGSFAAGSYNLSSTAWGGGKKIIVHVNTSVGGVKASNQADRNRVALRTGGWPAGTALQIDIGSSGRLQGAGGNGRQGATNSGTPAQAFPGTSALGIEYAAQINNNGTIRCGYGGGGGGAGSWSDPNKSKTDYGRSGGGGGGGAGIPAGDGGPANSGGYSGGSPAGSTGTAGQDGTFDAGGNQGNGFGVGADHGAGDGGGGNGGNGGDINDNPTNGTAGEPNRGAGGAAGVNGYGIIFGSNSIQSNSSGDKTISANQGGVIVGGIF